MKLMKNYHLSILVCFLLFCHTCLSGPHNTATKVLKYVHYIWLGELLPDEHMKTMLENKQYTKGLKTILWTDNPVKLKIKYDFPQAIDFRDYKELTADDYNIDSIVSREVNGVYKNYAAASDVLRLQALKKWGGVYFDVDVHLNAPIPYHDDNFASAFRLAETTYYHFRKPDIKDATMSNAILISPNGNGSLCKVIKDLSEAKAYIPQEIDISFLKRERLRVNETMSTTGIAYLGACQEKYKDPSFTFFNWDPYTLDIDCSGDSWRRIKRPKYLQDI